jgi:hypothetical protein
MLPLKVNIQITLMSKFSDYVLKHLFSLLPLRVKFDQSMIEGASGARAELHSENCTDFMLSPEVK